MKNHFLTTIIFIFLLFVSKEACAADSSTISLWAMGAEGEKMGVLARAFEAEHPGVKIITQTIPWGEAHAKLITAYVGGHAPDIAQLGTTWTPELRAMNALVPLDTYIARDSFDGRAFFPGAWKTVAFKDGIYGIPWYVETRCLYYRKDLLEKAGFRKPPETWQELEEMGKKLTRPPVTYGLFLPERDEQFIMPFVGQAGGKILDEKDEPQVATEPFERALSFYVSLFDKGIVRRGQKDTDMVHAFAEENPPFAMFISGPWMLSQIEEKAPGLKGRWGVAPLPGEKVSSSYLGGCNLVLFKSTRNPGLAWEFMRFVTSKETELKWYRTTGDLPSRPDAWSDAALSANPSLQAFRKQLDSAEPPPGIPEWEQMADVIAGRMEQAVLRKKSVHDASQALQEDIRTILRRRTEAQPVLHRVLVLGGVALIIFTGLFLYFRRAISEEGGAPRREGGGMKGRGESLWGPIFLFPALSILAIFLFLPVIVSFLMSLTNYDLYSLASWSEIKVVGLANYHKILADPRFWKSVTNTFIFAMVGGPLTIIVALCAALAIEKMTRMRALYLLGFFLPVVTTMVAVAIVWKWIYHPRFGLLNALLIMVHLSPRDWLSNPQTALWALMAMAIWKNFGYTMIILLSGLQAIPRSYYEASELDGAGRWSRFREITIPLLKPTLFLVSILTTIGYLQFFAEPYVMTQGGPIDSTLSVVLYLYQKGFKFYLLGEAAATSFILFFFIFLFSLGQLIMGKKSEANL
jgi:ABC-type sugar transport system permease subunit/ABC-type glycerol-3-phosphate transport system substrate-binding protein